MMEEITCTNNEVLTLIKNSGQLECLKVLFQQKSLETDLLASSEAYKKALKKLSTQELSLRKSKHKPGGLLKYNDFLNDQFHHPKCLPQACHPKVTSDESIDLNASFIQEKEKNLKLTESFKEGENKIKNLESHLQVTEAKLNICKTKVKRVAAREEYANKKVQKLEERVTGSCCDENKLRIKELETQLDRKNKEIKELNENCEYLSDLLKDIDNKERNLNVFDEKSRKYTHSLKTCVYELLTHNVSASKVSCVINAVLKLVSVVANKLPCRSTVLQMNIHRLDLAQTQLCEVFSTKENTTLMTDETSKFGSKYMGYEAADEDGNLWVLGLREIETKSADHTLKVFKQILGDLDEKCSDNSVSKDIVTHIIATMSDRAATELKFNDLLKSFRKEVLPLTYKNYDTFNEDEKKNVEHLCNFFCGLHSLVNFAENARKCTKEVEQGIFDGSIPISDPTYKDNDSGSCRLIRTTTKAFGEGSGGDEKSGAQGKFKIYIKEFLHDKGLRNVPLRSYKGTRFNVLYENAASVFFLHHQIKDFLQEYGAENRLLKSIQHDLETVEFVAGMKALGLLSKFITCPLWNILENEETKIIQMNEKYDQLKTTLENSSKNINDFMKGKVRVFGEDTYIEKGPIYESLIADDDFDDKVEMFLEILLPAMAQLCQKLYKDHLPGGAHTTLPTETVKKLTGTPKTSCFAESIFGQLDQLVRIKPNLSTLAAEAGIMFVNNQTLQWLESKDENEKKVLIKNASRNVKKHKRDFKARLSEIEANRYMSMQEKIKQREKLEKEKLKKQQNYTTDILNHGLWQSASEVENMVRSYEKETEQVKALKAQLRFRKEVLKQKPSEKGMFNFTKQLAGQSRKELTIDELKTNLKNLVIQAVVQDHENQTEVHMLVGKRVRHRFQTGENEDTWYSGKVISQVPSFPHWFNIIYDDDPAIYTYHNLPKDQDQNDLEILVN